MARAGTTTPFWWGSSISATQANYDSTYPMRAGPRVTGVREPSASITSRPIPGVCTVSTATYGNGSRTAGTIIAIGVLSGVALRPPAYLRSSFCSGVAASDRRYAIEFSISRVTRTLMRQLLFALPLVAFLSSTGRAEKPTAHLPIKIAGPVSALSTIWCLTFAAIGCGERAVARASSRSDSKAPCWFAFAAEPGAALATELVRRGQERPPHVP